MQVSAAQFSEGTLCMSQLQSFAAFVAAAHAAPRVAARHFSTARVLRSSPRILALFLFRNQPDFSTLFLRYPLDPTFQPLQELRVTSEQCSEVTRSSCDSSQVRVPSGWYFLTFFDSLIPTCWKKSGNFSGLFLVSHVKRTKWQPDL